MLSYPWPSEKESPFYFGGPPRDGTVGERIKTMICNTYAYQRLPTSEIANKALAILRAFPVPRDFPWAIPDKVAVIYNMAFGPQKCKDIEGFPSAKRDGLSCPLGPGEGGSSPSSVTYVADPPTQYLSSDWTGFPTASGSASTPPGVFITASFTETIIVSATTDTSGGTTSTETIVLSTSALEISIVYVTQTVATITSGTEYTTTWTLPPIRTSSSSSATTTASQ